MRTATLAGNVILLAVFGGYTGLATILTVLLPIRCLALEPANRKAFHICTVIGLCLFAESYWAGIYVEHRPAELLAPLVLIPLYGMALVLNIMFEELRLSEEALAASNTELTLRAARWETIAAAAERYRAVRDVEDQVGLELATLSDQLDTLMKIRDEDPDSAKMFTFRARSLASLASTTMHRLASKYQRSTLLKADLSMSLRDICHGCADTSGLSIVVEMPDVQITDPVVVSNMGRITREALVNIVRHSTASRVQVSCFVANDLLTLRITDDGIGFLQNLVPMNGGFATMRKCACWMGGTLEIQSLPSRGTRVTAKAPIVPARS